MTNQTDPDMPDHLAKEAIYEEAHDAVAIAIAECFLRQHSDLPWEVRSDELATAAIEAMQIFISMCRTHLEVRHD